MSAAAATGTAAVALQHPPGQGADGAPKGLVDIWMSPPPATGLTHWQGLLAEHGATVVFGGVLAVLLLVVIIALWRYRRVWLFRWRLRRFATQLQGSSSTIPVPTLAAALMWALGRYLDASPAIDRRRLPAHWHALVRQLDALRFAPGPQDDPTPLRAIVEQIRAMRLRRNATC